MAKSDLKKKKVKIKLDDMNSGSTTAKSKTSKAKAGGAQKTSSSKKKSSKKSSGSTKKSTKKSSGSTKKSAPRRSLDPAREKLNVLTQEANRRYWALREQGITSRAVLEAERSLTNAHKVKYFDTNLEMFSSNLKSTAEINREIARTMAFLNDPTSLAKGDENFKSEMYEGLFGGQWRENGGEGFDPSRVDPKDAAMVFDIYHRVIEAGGGWDRVIGFFKLMSPGIIDYGSENLINSIYDMVQNKGAIQAVTGIEDIEGAILQRTMEMLDEMVKLYESLNEMQEQGNDYGSILTKKELETNKAYWEYLKSKKGK